MTRITFCLVLSAFSLCVGCDRDVSDVRSRTEAASAHDATAQPLKVARSEPPRASPAIERSALPSVEPRPSVAVTPPVIAPTFPLVSGAQIRRLSVTRGVQGREPIDVIDLEQGVGIEGPVYAFVDIANSSDEPLSVVITFETDGLPSVGHMELEVPANVSRWRTWARSRMLNRPGTWAAVVRKTDGEELGRLPFVVR